MSLIVIKSVTDCETGGERENLPSRLSLGRSQECLYTDPAVWHREEKILVLKAAFSFPISFLQEVFIVSGDFPFRPSCEKIICFQIKD